MNIQDLWEKALSNTEIVRPRVHYLQTHASTDLLYIFLAESSVNNGDTVVRKGKITVDKPAIILPPNLPQFDGFDFEDEMKIDKNTLTNFLLVRGVRFPSLKYNNKTSLLDLREGPLRKSIKFYSEKLEKEENTNMGLIVGPEDCWQFSVLIFICSQIAKSAHNDIKRFFENI